jgi:hypothetical protein
MRIADTTLVKNYNDTGTEDKRNAKIHQQKYQMECVLMCAGGNDSMEMLEVD